jgi:hypothetical protein
MSQLQVKALVKCPQSFMTPERIQSIISTIDISRIELLKVCQFMLWQ